MKPEKLLRLILEGKKSVRFHDFCLLVEAYEFQLDRINGSHHIYKREGITELNNLQNYNGETKSYQIRQFLNIVEKYGLKLEKKS